MIQNNLQKVVILILNGIIIPLVNKEINGGASIPSVEGFTLKNSVTKYGDGYVDIESDFDFTPPFLEE